MSDEERFNVWQYLPDDYHEQIGTNLSASEAVKLAHSYTRPTRPGVMMKIIKRVIITCDNDESVCFEWVNGKGVTYPPEQAGKQ